jgi:hypothetical protein
MQYEIKYQERGYQGYQTFTVDANSTQEARELFYSTFDRNYYQIVSVKEAH